MRAARSSDRVGAGGTERCPRVGENTAGALCLLRKARPSPEVRKGDEDVRSRRSAHGSRDKRARGSSRPLAAKDRSDVRGTPPSREVGSPKRIAGPRTGGSRIAWESRFGVDRDTGLVVEKVSCGLQMSVETDRGRRRYAPRGACARSSLDCDRSRVTTGSTPQAAISPREGSTGAARAGSWSEAGTGSGSRPLDASESS